ncbi:MAG TPA: hypothetical protein VFF30_12515 [Nitrososphaerales archaeon]|nr:hypothetical protein [Nitrososphaerales archaeon]
MRKRTIALIVVLVIILIIGIVAVQLYLEYSAAKNLSISVVKVGAQNVKVDSATVTLTLLEPQIDLPSSRSG